MKKALMVGGNKGLDKVELKELRKRTARADLTWTAKVFMDDELRTKVEITAPYEVFVHIAKEATHALVAKNQGKEIKIIATTPTGLKFQYRGKSKV